MQRNCARIGHRNHWHVGQKRRWLSYCHLQLGGVRRNSRLKDTRSSDTMFAQLKIEPGETARRKLVGAFGLCPPAGCTASFGALPLEVTRLAR